MSVARVAIFEGINVEAAQATMDEAEAIIRPMIEGLPGYEGATELASADGKFISITVFDSEENARAAEPTFDQEMPQKLGHIFEQWAGNRTSVGHYVVVGEDRR
jgi:heme-degrading monooxygenase HmoA